MPLNSSAALTRRLWGAFLALSAGVMLFGGCRSRTGPLRLGVALPLTDAGVLPMRRGAELAQKEINAAGGIQGQPLELVLRDDYGDPDSSVAVAAAFYGSDVVAVIGSAYSGPTLSAAPVYNHGAHPLVQLSPSASSPDLSAAGDFTFRICPSDLKYGAALARFTERGLGLRRGAILYVDDDYGRGIRHAFEAEFDALNGLVLEADPFLAASPDVGPYLTRLARRGDVQFLVLAAQQEEGLHLLEQIRASHLKIPILAGDGFVGIEGRSPLAEGVYVATAYLPGDTAESNRKFVSAYRRAYPDQGAPDQGAAASYDAVYLLSEVLRTSGGDRARLRDVLAETGRARPAFEGATGSIGFDIEGDVPDPEVKIGVVERGQLVPSSSGR